MLDDALSDAVLALCAAWAGFRLLGRPAGASTAGVGLLLMSLAAAFGSLRFSVAPELAGTHTGVTRLAQLVGLPMVGTGYLTTAFVPKRAMQIRPYSFVVLLLLAVALIGVPVYQQGIGALAVVAILVAGFGLSRRAAMLAWLGAITVAISGFVVLGDGQGDWGPMSRVAWFHLGIAFASVTLSQGLAQTKAP